ncbi:hypothetical protein BDP55DRAFT_735558 [Colletotrichum godetiae]|uniref:Uncharacterized protein n=1 Tax=Colletotrichum godetiae TaxID=1209918 RepID=A0AAJ0A509_9PEZI|nr:uncharacterized protein BDP55DRAFT_735558 [Colletotrichum godetiae]KAK1656616.1 hypothetical protein BDP55DRAFT_735558 [Colletotrichum godetiae]
MASDQPYAFLKTQTIDNLQLLSERNGHITVHTSLQLDGSYTVHAAEAYRNKRREILSGSGKTLLEAFESLHRSSALEVHRFTKANGYAFPLRSASGDHNDGEPDSSDTEASTADIIVLSDSPFHNEAGTRCRPGESSSRRRKFRQKKKKLQGYASSSSSSSEGEKVPIDSRPTNVTKRNHTAVVHTPRQQDPMLPTVALKAYPAGSGGKLNDLNGHSLAVHALPPPPPPPPPSIRPMMQPPHPQNLARTPVSSTPTKAVRLVVKWHGHGDRRIIWDCMPSYMALQSAALTHLGRKWQSFDNVSASEFCSDMLNSLVVKEIRIEVGNEMYSISTAGGDDMSVHFRTHIMPKFEVIVGHHGGIASSPPAP